MKEGIPEYTGWKLSNFPRSEFVAALDSAPTTFPSFVRSFVYFTGPAYAMLLDDYTGGEWRHHLASSVDLQSMLDAAIASRNFPDDSLVRVALSATGGTAVSPLVTELTHARALNCGSPVIVAIPTERWSISHGRSCACHWAMSA